MNETLESYVQRCRERGDEFPCRMCDECARSAEGRIVGDFIAQKQVSQRCMVALLTYDDKKLLAAGRPSSDRDSIPICKEDARLFVRDFRKMLRRLHPDLVVSMDAYRITEMAQLVEHDNHQRLDQFGRRIVILPRINSPPRAHHHVCLWFNVRWKDGDKQRRKPAQWKDELIPHLRCDEWLYNHEWENKAEAKARGGRVRKLARPWPWGFISYGEPRGGEGAYFAKYISKAMMLRMKYKEDKYREWSADELLDFQRSEESWKSCRKSPGLGKIFYRQQGEKQAEAGLPPRLAFQTSMGIEVGGLYERNVYLPGGESFIDGEGVMRFDGRNRKALPSFMLQRIGRQRALLTAYDERRRELHGDVAEPRGPNYRRKIVNGRERMVIVYGVDEAREAIAKDDDRRFSAKRERRLRRARRGDKLACDRRGGRRRRVLDVLSGKLSETLAASMPRAAVVVEAKRLPIFWPGRDFRGLVQCWSAEFEREVIPELGPKRNYVVEVELYQGYLYTWLRGQVGLGRFSDEKIVRLRNAIVGRKMKPDRLREGPLHWTAWRKGRMKAGTICG